MIWFIFEKLFFMQYVKVNIFTIIYNFYDVGKISELKLSIYQFNITYDSNEFIFILSLQII